MAVKCIQKLIPYLKMCDYNKNIINILNKVYEENIYHNDKETLKIYYNDFNEPIHKKYEIIDRISSGSIGQIYKIKNIYTNTLYAMKVVHPNIKYHISFIQSMIKLFNLQTFIFFELDVFMNNFINETDFIKESENMKLFIDYYKDNDRIIIPEVYEYSRNIIIMDFIEGEIITNLSIYEKSKYIILSLLFCNNNK
jgi:predicted unusual protein kinase regulating ubiquinone biosynthesis (AarF/ABC1/UbiB family)